MADGPVTRAEMDNLTLQVQQNSVQIQQHSVQIQQNTLQTQQIQANIGILISNMNNLDQRIARVVNNITARLVYLNEQVTAAAGDVVTLQHDAADNHMRDFAHRVPFEMLQQDVRNLQDVQDQLRGLIARIQQGAAPNHHGVAPYLPGHANGPNATRLQGQPLNTQNLVGRVASLERLYRDIEARLTPLERNFGREVLAQARLLATVNDQRGDLAALRAELAGRDFITPLPPNHNIQHWLQNSHPAPINRNLTVPAHNIRHLSPTNTEYTGVGHTLVAPTANASNGFPAADGSAVQFVNRGSSDEEEPTAEAPASAYQTRSSRSSLNPLAEPFTIIQPDFPTINMDQNNKPAHQPAEGSSQGAVQKQAPGYGLEHSMWADDKSEYKPKPPKREFRPLPIAKPSVPRKYGSMTLGEDKIVTPTSTPESGRTAPAITEPSVPSAHQSLQATVEDATTGSEHEVATTNNDPLKKTDKDLDHLTRLEMQQYVTKELATLAMKYDSDPESSGLTVTGRGASASADQANTVQTPATNMDNEDSGKLIPGLADAEIFDTRNMGHEHTTSPKLDLLDSMEDGLSLQAPVKPTKKEPKPFSIKSVVAETARYNAGVGGGNNKKGVEEGSSKQDSSKQDSTKENSKEPVEAATSSPFTVDKSGVSKVSDDAAYTHLTAASKAIVPEEGINLTFRRVKMKVQAGGNGPFIAIGHLNKEAFDVVSVNLLIKIVKKEPITVAIQSTNEDEGVLVSCTFIVPNYIIGGTMTFDVKNANQNGILPANSEPMQELNSLKDTITGLIPGNLRMMKFAYTAPNIVEQMELAKEESAYTEMATSQANFHRFFAALCDWQGGNIGMLFTDEGNDAKVVNKAFGLIKEACGN